MKLYCKLNGKEYRATSITKMRRAIRGDNFNREINIKKFNNKKLYRLFIDGVGVGLVKDLSYDNTCCSNRKHCQCSEYLYEGYDMCCDLTNESCGDYEKHHGCEDFKEGI